MFENEALMPTYIILFRLYQQRHQLATPEVKYTYLLILLNLDKNILKRNETLK